MSELAAPHDLSIHAVMNHVGKREDAGLVRPQKTGRVETCPLRIDSLDEPTRWLQELLEFWHTRLDALNAHLAKQKKTNP